MEEIILIEIETLLKSKYNTYLAYLDTFRSPELTLENVIDYNIKVGETVLVDSYPTIKIYIPSDRKESDNLIHNDTEEVIFSYSVYFDVFLKGDDSRTLLLTLMRYKEAFKELMKKYSTLNGKVIGSIVTGSYNTNLFRSGHNLHQGARVELKVYSQDTDSTVKVE